MSFLEIIDKSLAKSMCDLPSLDISYTSRVTLIIYTYHDRVY
jgi:hypothetical protein